MVSKNTAVRSIRLPNETWEWLAAEAEKRGTTVNGLVAEGVALLRTPPLSIASDYAKRVEARVASGGFKPQPTPLIESVKASMAAVPLHKPKPFNPQPKKGTKK